MADTLSPSTIEAEARRIQQGDCAYCRGPGPVDVHTSYRIISALVVSYHQDLPILCCTRCARNAQGRDLSICLAAGWWSLHGIILTPIKVFQNLHAMSSRRDTSEPSAALREIARLRLGNERLQKMGSVAENPTETRTPASRPRSSPTTPPDIRTPTNSALAITGMVLGILSIVLLCCLPLGIAALICSILALHKIKQGALHPDNRRWALTGLITGSIGTLIAISMLVLSALLKT